MVSAPGHASTRSAELHRQPGTAAPVTRRVGSFDSRLGGAAVAVSAQVQQARSALSRSLGPLAVVAPDPITGTLRFVGRLDGFLTPRSSRPARAIALGYVRDRLAAFGLSRPDLATFELPRDYVDILGTHHLSWIQRAGGLPVFGSGISASVTARGQLVNVTGSPAHGLTATTSAASLDASAAIVAARSAAGGAWTRSTSDTAERVLFPTARGIRLAWKTFTRISDAETDLSIVDAVTGEVLWRANLTVSDSEGVGQAVEYYPGDVPLGGGEPHQVSFPVLDETALSGNNAHVYSDPDDDDAADPADEVPSISGLHWSYVPVFDTTTASQNCSTLFFCTWDMTVPRSWEINREAFGVQLYHFLNVYHDHLLADPIGFTEAAGNFQLVNESGLGLGGDPVQGQFLDGANLDGGVPDASHLNDANMSTPPDGGSPTMQLYLNRTISSFPTIPTSDSGSEADTVYHEYTHGLSGRLVTFPDGTWALSSAQAGAMGEGWSDWYAIDFADNQGYFFDTPASGDAVIFRYTAGGGMFRHEATDCPVGVVATGCEGTAGSGPGGFTYGDFGHVRKGPEVHADGEIWTQTLWDVREALGSFVTEGIVTRAMELSPPEPTYLEMRNAIIQADQVAHAGAHVDELWSIFAHRGMGFFAATVNNGDTSPVEDFSLPVTCAVDPCGSISGTVTDQATSRPMEGVRVSVAGMASGFDLGLEDTTDSTGGFEILGVPFHDYPKIVAGAVGYEPFAAPVSVDGAESVEVDLVRDWAALEGGATLQSFTPPDYTGFCGFGADGAFDLSIGSGWPSDSPANGDSGVAGPRAAIVRLPVAVDVTSFGVASGGSCGDESDAGVKVFTMQVRRRVGWITVLTARALPDGMLRTYLPLGDASDVRLVRFVMRSNYGNPFFMDVLEVTVRGTVHHRAAA